jgi:hypothetical protein
LRNRDPILAVLRTVLPSSGMVLEVASGTGEHVVHFARHVPNLEWQPSDPSAAARASIAAWVATEGLTNVGAPLEIDVAQHPWPIHQAAAIVCINMVHISPWDATVGLMRGASQLLPSGGALYLYGPFRRSGRPLEPTNEIFDRDLRSRDLRWGLRDLDAVVQCAADHCLAFERVVEMSANNLSVTYGGLGISGVWTRGTGLRGSRDTRADKQQWTPRWNSGCPALLSFDPLLS